MHAADMLPLCIWDKKAAEREIINAWALFCVLKMHRKKDDDVVGE